MQIVLPSIHILGDPSGYFASTKSGNVRVSSGTSTTFCLVVQQLDNRINVLVKRHTTSSV